MKVKTTYKGFTLALNRSLGGISFLVNGEVMAMKGGKLINHKMDHVFTAEIEDGYGNSTSFRAELKLGWLVDKVYFYHQDKLVDEKILL